MDIFSVISQIVMKIPGGNFTNTQCLSSTYSSINKYLGERRTKLFSRYIRYIFHLFTIYYMHIYYDHSEYDIKIYYFALVFVQVFYKQEIRVGCTKCWSNFRLLQIYLYENTRMRVDVHFLDKTLGYRIWRRVCWDV